MPDLLHANDRAGEYPRSWYAETAPLRPARPALSGAHGFDVCIVGAGFTGLSAAIHLAQAGYKVAVVEAHRAGWGASGRNGGQAGTGQRRPQDELEAALGIDMARRLWGLAEEAKALVRSLCAEHSIDCDITPGIIHADHKPRYVPHSEAYALKLNEEYGYDRIRFVGRDEMRQLVGSKDYHGGTQDSGAFHLHPLKYVLGLAAAAEAAGATIFENSEVTKITCGTPVKVATAKGEVEADWLLVACNGYLGGLEPETASRVMPINNFIIATEPLGEARARSLIADNSAVADSRFVINYFRLTPDQRLLFGGGENYGYRFPADIKAFVRQPMLKVFPQLKDVAITHGWGGTLAITARRLPAFRRVAGNILSASGYSGHGVTIATLAGKLCAEAVRGQAERFDLMASIPHLPFPGGRALRHPLLVLAMTWYALRDRM